MLQPEDRGRRATHIRGGIMLIVVAIAGVLVYQRPWNGASADAAHPLEQLLHVETVASRLDTPWDLAWGPDSALWFTERGGSISRLDVRTHEITRVGGTEVTEFSESGLMGLAFHPDFSNAPWVYAVHSYGGRGSIGNRLVRFWYEHGTLGPPQVLLDEIPGAPNHDGSRLAFGPDGFLYMTTGDAQQPRLAQDTGSVAGKVLRLDPSGRPAPGNPFGNAVWSLGHRNPQGLVFDPRNGALFSTEHGPGEADEVNRIEAGRNYGWPAINGFCDEPQEASFCGEHDVTEPLAQFTPTVAIAGLDYYDGDLIPEWKGSLLATSLRGATLLRIALSPNGRQATRVDRLYRGEFGRLRDVLVAPDGSVYLATSNRDGRAVPGLQDDRILRLSR